MRVVITGGGTYGHVSPLEPIADHIRQLDSPNTILFIGMKGDQFSRLLAKGKHVDDVILISTGKYRRYPDEPFLRRLFDVKTHVLNVRDLFRIVFGAMRARRAMKQFEPDVVFGNGGHVSVPVGWAAGRLGIPLVIHESDSKMGMANRLLARKAKVICTGMPTITYSKKFADKLEHTGIPIRRSFAEAVAQKRVDLMQKLGLDPELKTVVVSGSSQGAMAINEALIQALPQLLKQVQVVHITGEKNLAVVTQAAKQLDIQLERYQAIGFTESIAEYYAVADVVVNRASATVFAELAYLSKPTILIPADHLSDQVENAEQIATRRAAIVLRESNINQLGHTIVELLQSPSQLEQLSDQITAYAVPDATDRIVKILLRFKPTDGTVSHGP